MLNYDNVKVVKLNYLDNKFLPETERVIANGSWMRTSSGYTLMLSMGFMKGWYLKTDYR